MDTAQALGCIESEAIVAFTIPTDAMSITCFIRYEVDPFQRDAFAEYANRWATIIPKCGGSLVGYFLPHEGSNYIAWGVISFDCLGAYEAYRARLKADQEARENFAFAATRHFILREERTFLEPVPSTQGIPPSTRVPGCWP